MGSETTATSSTSFKCFPGTPVAPAGHHQLTVTSIAHSREKNVFVSSGTDGTILQWKCGEYAQPEKVLSKDSSPVWTTTIVGNKAVSGLENGTIVVVDLNSTGRTVLEGGHSAAVCKLASYGSDKFVSASRDFKALIWSLGKDTPDAELAGHSNGLTDVVVFGDKAATASLDSTIKVWDLKTGQALSTLKGHSMQVTCLALVSDSVLASGSTDGSVRVWNLDSSECTKTIQAHTTSVTGLHKVLENQIVSTGWDGNAKVWDPVSGKSKGVMEPPKDRNTRDKDNGICSSCVALDSKLIASYFSNKVVVWDCKSTKVISEKTIKGFPSAVGVDMDGKNGLLGLSYGEIQNIAII